jgi:hypothetical protein
MTKGEAKAYLSFSDEQNLEDHYEEYLFKQKEFFRQKPVSKKIYTNQFLKIEKAIEAYGILGFKINKSSLVFNKTTFNEKLKEIFNLYHSTKNQLFQLLYSVESLEELILIGSQLLILEKEFASCFKEINAGDMKPQKTDPMDVLKNINELNQAGIHYTNQLNINQQSLYSSLFAEIQRLKSFSE